VTGVLIAGGLNFGYQLHPPFLFAALVTGLVAVGLGFYALTLACAPMLLRIAAPLAAVAACFGLVVALIEAEETDPQAVVRENAPLYAEISTHPDARRGPIVAATEGPDNDLFAEGYLNQPTCCWTNRTDELTTRLTVAEVAEFYRRAVEAEGWRVQRFGAGGPNQRVDLIGRRGDARLELDVRPRTGRPPVVDIIVDAH
jgi:hypothetical protein